MNVKHFLKIGFTLILLFLSVNSFALEQFAKQWLAVNAQIPMPSKQWLAFIYSQLRFINQAHPWQTILLESGIGRQLSEASTIIVGYRWSGRNPYNDFYQENRLFQQFIYQKKTDLHRFVLRTRLEEIAVTNNNQMAFRLRERFAMEITQALFKNAFPLLYDEIFFQLNHPSYVPRTFVGENRIFLGFNFYRTKKKWWEIGYINQYQIRTLQQNQNQMSHILSISYNF